VIDPLVPVVVLGGAICQRLQFRTALEYFFNGFLEMQQALTSSSTKLQYDER
jgi:hypothetical protein